MAHQRACVLPKIRRWKIGSVYCCPTCKRLWFVDYPIGPYGSPIWRLVKKEEK